MRAATRPLEPPPAKRGGTAPQGAAGADPFLQQGCILCCFCSLLLMRPRPSRLSLGQDFLMRNRSLTLRLHFVSRNTLPHPLEQATKKSLSPQPRSVLRGPSPPHLSSPGPWFISTPFLRLSPSGNLS